MEFVPTSLIGAFVIELDRKYDDRGFFARAFCQREFADHGIAPDVRQANLSYNATAGTLRGMHFQYPPASETKVVRCISGALFDVIVDLRPESPTFLQHTSVRLDADNRRALVVPPRFAHGFITLADDNEVLYLMSEFYAPAEEGGLPWNDPGLAIDWPREPAVIAARDASGFTPLADQRATLAARMAP